MDEDRDGKTAKTRPEVNLPGRRIAFAPEDEAAYAALLVEAFPDLRFYREPSRTETDSRGPGSAPPKIVLTRDIAEIPDRKRWLELIFDPDWEPRWEVYEYLNDWRIVNPSFPNATWERGGEFFAGGKGRFEGLTGGRIYFRVVKGDRAQAALARKALRLIGRVAGNKDLAVYRVPSLEFAYEDDFPPWVGRRARAWAEEKPNRFVNAEGAGIGLRPWKAGTPPPPPSRIMRVLRERKPVPLEKPDSSLAHGRTSIKSSGDFQATRKGDTIRIEGTVDHKWNDPYDFHEGQPGYEESRSLLAAGKANRFEMKAAWRQGVTATVRIVNGRLHLDPDKDVTWRDLKDLRDGPRK